MSLLKNTSEQLRASGLFDMVVELGLSLWGGHDSAQGAGERTFGFITEKSQAAAGNSWTLLRHVMGFLLPEGLVKKWPEGSQEPAPSQLNAVQTLWAQPGFFPKGWVLKKLLTKLSLSLLRTCLPITRVFRID
jgi:hypothetical protein